MSSVRISLEFAGVILPISKGEQSHNVVPLKPISDVFGLEWKRQYKKATSTLAKRFGTCQVHMYTAGQSREMTCIRLDRVAAFINSINPENVRSAGNVSGADFLEQKQEEWDDLIHEYEMAGGIFAGREQREAVQRERKFRILLALNKEKRATSDEQDRKVLAQLQRGLAAELGVAYQPDLVDDE